MSEFMDAVGRLYSDAPFREIDQIYNAANTYLAELQELEDLTNGINRTTEIRVRVEHLNGSIERLSAMLELLAAKWGLVRADKFNFIGGKIPETRTAAREMRSAASLAMAYCWTHPPEPLPSISIATATRPQEASVDKEKSEEVLVAMLHAKAFAFDQRTTTDQIARRIGNHATPGNYKTTVAALAVAGFIATKDGRRGGCWLTERGRREAEAIDKR